MRVKQLIKSSMVVGVLLVGSVATASANLILNPSFENNTAGGTQFNLSNAAYTALMADQTAFGAAEEIDIMQGAPFGLAPVDGQYKVGIHTVSPGGAADAFSFSLNGPIVAGQSYTLDFWAHAVTSFDPGLGPIEIGISSSANTFGTLVFTSGLLSTTAWTNFQTTFVAPGNASFLTVRSGPNETWAHIDDFSLTAAAAAPEPATMLLFGAGLAALAVRRRARRI